MTKKPTKQKRKPRKVAIVGKAPNTIGLAPYDDPTWEIWTLSNNAQLGEAKRWDRHVEIHQLSQIRDRPERKSYWEWLCSEPADGRPIYMQEVLSAVPASKAFPKTAVVDVFGGYFNNTVSWMMALALLEGVTDLALYGINMSCDGDGEDSEYAHQRPSCEYMIGWAMGMGVPVTLPSESDLLTVARLYGFDSEGNAGAAWRSRNKELAQREMQAQQKYDEALQHLCGLKGAREDWKHARKCHLG